MIDSTFSIFLIHSKRSLCFHGENGEKIILSKVTCLKKKKKNYPSLGIDLCQRLWSVVKDTAYFLCWPLHSVVR